HEVKIYGAQASELARYEELIERNLRLGTKVEATRAGASSVVQLLAAVALAVILVVAGLEAAKGRMSAGSIVAMLTAMMSRLPTRKRITNVLALSRRGGAAADRLFTVLDSQDESDTGTVAVDRVRGEIEFRQVGLGYAGSEQAALQDLSFRAAPGTVTA